MASPSRRPQRDDRKASRARAFTLGVTPTDAARRRRYRCPEEHAGRRSRAPARTTATSSQITFPRRRRDRAALHALSRCSSRSADELRAAGGLRRRGRRHWPRVHRDRTDRLRADSSRTDDVEHAVEQRDDIWRSVVNVDRRRADHVRFGAAAAAARDRRQRLEIKELASASPAPKCNVDGSPLITTQAAIVLATFRHLAGNRVRSWIPSAIPDVMRNVAGRHDHASTRTSSLQMMQTDEQCRRTPIVSRLARSQFDDEKVARAAGDGAGARRHGDGAAAHASSTPSLPTRNAKQRVPA